MGKQILCHSCNKFFSVLNKRRKFCSTECANRYYYKQRRKPTKLKMCKKCNKQFTTRISTKVFCSTQCKDVFHKSGIIKNKNCKHCGKPFECTNNSQLYCNHKCYYEAKIIRDKRRRNELSRSKGQ
jgi:hypothetical protein